MCKKSHQHSGERLTEAIYTEVSTVIEAIEKAKARRDTDLPLIIHSDRGSQYVSKAWQEATAKMQRSYSHSGYPYNNAYI